jgi:hypothetical protein
MSILLEMESEPQRVWWKKESIHILPRIGVVVNEKKYRDYNAKVVTTLAVRTTKVVTTTFHCRV